ncbi:hypothetical protein ACFRAE_08720 [Sphingobacterium sp. HJSM2_6]|uniref:hypothetical protein n=1 Tax=Sphingobacterium sp. HJSM2_6 TaxID=3366264 RepID=UPI003BE6AF2F
MSSLLVDLSFPLNLALIGLMFSCHCALTMALLISGLPNEEWSLVSCTSISETIDAMFDVNFTLFSIDFFLRYV